MATKDSLNGKPGITIHASNSNNQLQSTPHTIMGRSELGTTIGTIATDTKTNNLGKNTGPINQNKRVCAPRAITNNAKRKAHPGSRTSTTALIRLPNCLRKSI